MKNTMVLCVGLNSTDTPCSPGPGSTLKVPNACPAGRRRGAPAPDIHRHSFALPECRDHGVSLEGPPGTEGPDHQPGAHLPEGASNGVGAPARLTGLSVCVGSSPERSSTASAL